MDLASSIIFDTKLKMNITLMVCGPIHVHSVDILEYYKTKFTDVLYSTWEPNNERERELLVKIKTHLTDDKIFLAKYKDLPEKYHNVQNVYYQAYTWNNGCKMVKTDYCVKIRTNCTYRNVEPIISKIVDHPNKIVCSSIFFRPVGFIKYAPSDHIISMKTSEAIKTTELLLDLLVSDISDKLDKIPAEVKICFCQLSTRYVIDNPKLIINPCDINLSRKHLQENYEIVNINHLEPTISTHNIVRNHFDHGSGVSVTDVKDL